NSLDIVQKFVAEQQVAPTEQESPVVENVTEKESDRKQEPAESQGSSILKGLLAAGLVLLIGAASAGFYVYRKKREN
ncbi:MAG: hypothetical protein RR642_13345, partial [Solibacillus sp.]